MNDIPKHITVEIPKGAVGKGIGSAMSIRLPIVMTDESGKEIKGFFTRDEFASTNDLTYSRSLSMANADQYAPFLEAMRSSETDIYKGFFRYLDDHAFHMNDISKMEEKDAASKILNTLLNSREGYGLIRSFVRDVVKLPEAELNKVIPELEPGYIINKKGVPFARFFSAVIARASKMSRIANAHVSIQGQSANANINRRNNAMSDYADLVGAPGLIARSVNMTVVQDGKATQGTYMLNADGITCADFNVNNPDLKTDGKSPLAVALEAEAKRDLSRIQLIDFLCGNLDRHSGNFRFRVDKSDPTKVRIVGVIGIDNDSSFGKIAHTGTPDNRYMSPLKDIKVIDGVQADAILRLTPDKLDQKIRLAGLTKEEIDAAHERLAALQKRIRDKDIRIIRSMKEWDDLDLTKLETKAKDDSFINLFSMVGRKVRGFFRPAYAEANDESLFPKVKAKVVNIQEDETLGSYAQRLEEVQKSNKKYHIPMTTSPTQEPYRKALQDTVDELNRLQKTLEARGAQPGKDGVQQTLLRQLTDMERNHLAQSFKNLQELAEKYASAEHTRPRTKADQHFQEVLLNTAKNAAAFAADARRQIQTISPEAEKNLATKLAKDIAEEKLGIPKEATYVPPAPKEPMPHSYEELMGQLSNVDSRWIHSSPAFKNLIEDLKAVEGSERFPTENARKVGFQKLGNSVAAYLTYKKKQYEGDKEISPYAKDRIKFALRIGEFAAARLNASKKSLEDISKAGEHIQSFLDRCKTLQKEYKAAKDYETREQCLDRIADFREEYRKGCETLSAIAKAHPDDRPTQLACYNNLTKGPIAAFQTMYKEAQKAFPEIPDLFEAEEETKLKENIRTMDENCKAFPQTNAKNVVTRPAPNGPQRGR